MPAEHSSFDAQLKTSLSLFFQQAAYSGGHCAATPDDRAIVSYSCSSNNKRGRYLGKTVNLHNPI
jgi:hypothetical protein